MNMGVFASSDEALEQATMLAQALGTSIPMLMRPQDRDLLAGAQEFRFGPEQSRLGWSIGEGRIVMFVHGYSGRGVQMAALARSVAALGFRAVFFDAGGHGDSRSEKIGFFTFINDTAALIEHLDEPIFAMIGHSAGGLAMMRSRAIHKVSAQRYGLISAPFFPYVPLETMQTRGASEQALPYLKAILADQFRTTWSSLTAGVAFEPESGKPLLAIYDIMDERVRHTDAERLSELWPNVKIVKTDGYGHNRVLQAKETLQALSEFLTQDLTGQLSNSESPARGLSGKIINANI